MSRRSECTATRAGLVCLVLFVCGAPQPAAIAQLANSVWPDYGGGARNTHQSTINGPQTLPSIRWSYDIPQGGGTDVPGAFTQPSIAPDGSTYFITSSINGSHINAFEFDGTFRYRIGSLGAIGPWLTLDAQGHMDYGRYQTTINLVQRQQSNGALVWQWGNFNNPFSTNVQGSPAIAPDGTIYASSDDADLRAFTSAGTNTWNSTGNGYHSNPAIADNGNIITGGRDVRAISPAGAVLWTYPLEGVAYFNSPAIDGAGNIYAGQGYGPKLVSLTPEGTVRWTRSGIGGAPSIGPDGTIYAGYSGSIYALNPANGNTIWSYTTGELSQDGSEGITIDADGDLYLSTVSGHVLSFTSGGLLRWDYDLDPLSTRSVYPAAPVIGPDGTLYVGGGNSKKIFALAVPEPTAIMLVIPLLWLISRRAARVGCESR